MHESKLNRRGNDPLEWEHEDFSEDMTLETLLRYFDERLNRLESAYVSTTHEIKYEGE